MDEYVIIYIILIRYRRVVLFARSRRAKLIAVTSHGLACAWCFAPGSMNNVCALPPYKWRTYVRGRADNSEFPLVSSTVGEQVWKNPLCENRTGWTYRTLWTTWGVVPWRTTLVSVCQAECFMRNNIRGGDTFRNFF